MVPRIAPLLAALLIVGLPLITKAADGAWQIVKIENRDYLTIQNIADFYGLRGDIRVVDHRMLVGDAHASLEFNGNPREITVNGVKQWLSFPVVIRDNQALVSRFDLAKTIDPALRPTMISNLQPFHTVVIDAGHGGQDMGASSVSGYEKSYTLDVIADLKKALEARGLKVILTRANDSYLSLEQRAQIANDTADAVFLSVHFNSEPNGRAANGFEVYAMTPRGAASTGDFMVTADQFKPMPGNEYDDASFALANSVQNSLLGQMPEGDRGVRRARFAVLRLVHAPAILVEGGFLTNGPDGSKINDSAWRQKLAVALADGVASFQDLSEHHRPPKLLADYRSERLPLTGTIVDPSANAARAALSCLPLLPTANLSSSFALLPASEPGFLIQPTIP